MSSQELAKSYWSGRTPHERVKDKEQKLRKAPTSSIVIVDPRVHDSKSSSYARRRWRFAQSLSSFSVLEFILVSNLAQLGLGRSSRMGRRQDIFVHSQSNIYLPHLDFELNQDALCETGQAHIDCCNMLPEIVWIFRIMENAFIFEAIKAY